MFDFLLLLCLQHPASCKSKLAFVFVSSLVCFYSSIVQWVWGFISIFRIFEIERDALRKEAVDLQHPENICTFQSHPPRVGWASAGIVPSNTRM